jgi:hypothetical protein
LRPREAQGLRRAGAILDPRAKHGFISVERDLSSRIVDMSLLEFEQRNGVGELVERLHEFARLVDAVNVRRVELDDAAPVLERAVRTRQLRLGPRTPELEVQLEEALPRLRVRTRERRQELRQLFPQSDEGFLLAPLRVESGQPLGRNRCGRVLVDRGHEIERRVVGIAHGERPHVRRFAQPVRRIRRVGRRHPNPLE